MELSRKWGVDVWRGETIVASLARRDLIDAMAMDGARPS